MSKNKRTRYVPSWGLAFVEKREMEKLSKLSEEGWILDSFAFLGYKLCKGNNEKLIYSVDYNDLPVADQEEYFEIFKEGGWTHVCAQGSIHVFSSKPGTQPIYSDTNTMCEKYKRAITPWKISAVVFSLLASASIILQLVFQQDLLIVDILGGLALVLAAPSLMTYIGLGVRLKRLNNG